MILSHALSAYLNSYSNISQHIACNSYVWLYHPANHRRIGSVQFFLGLCGGKRNISFLKISVPYSHVYMLMFYHFLYFNLNL
jgi:hypothetical protein